MEKILGSLSKGENEELELIKKDSIYIWRTLRTLSNGDLLFFKLTNQHDLPYSKILDEIFIKMIPNLKLDNKKSENSTGSSKKVEVNEQSDSPANGKNGLKRVPEGELLDSGTKQVKTN